MSKFRLFVADQPTEWEEETVRVGHGATAALRVAELRRQHPDAAIRIEREGDRRPTLPMFRYQIFVKDGMMPVVDEEGTVLRKVSGTLQTRPFYEYERDKVLAEIRERFPDAQLQEVKVG